jgi:hypothetical protein
MSNVVSLSEYRERKSSKTGRMIVGEKCFYEDRLVTIVGTWAFTGHSGPPGSVETREHRFGSDPRLDKSAKGYILQPMLGGKFILSPWGDVAIGTLKPIY